MLMDKIKASQKPLLIITEASRQTQLLKDFYKNKIFKPITFMQKQDLFEKVFFKFTEDALIEASFYLDLKPSIVKPLLKTLYFIDTTQDYENPNIKTLQALKSHLINAGKIMPFNHVQTFFKQYHVLIIDTPVDQELKPVIEKIETYTTVETYQSRESGTHAFYYQDYETVEEEITQTLLAINALTAQGISLDEITLVDLPNSYKVPLKTMAKRFNMPLNFDQKKTLIQFPLCQTFLKHLSESEDLDIYQRFSEALEKLKAQKVKDPLNEKVMMKLINTINPLITSSKSYEAIYPFLIDRLKTTQIVIEQSQGALNHLTLDSIDLNKHKVLFFLGLHEGHFPHVKTEDDFLDEASKKALGLMTAEQLNQTKKDQILHFIDRCDTVYFSYAKTSMMESFFKAHLLQTVKERYGLKPFKPYPLSEQSVSYDAALLYTKKLYDNYLIYHEYHEDLPKLFNTFQENFAPYDTQFKPLQNSMQSKLLKEQLNLSYTKLDKFFECKFKYLLDALLKVDPSEDSINLDFGNIFHKILETYIDESTLTDSMIDAVKKTVLKDKTLDTKSKVFIDRLNEPIKKAFLIIKKQHENSKFKLAALEKRIQKTYDHKAIPVVLSGVIDKLLSFNESLVKRFVIIDYKTGKETLNLNHAVYGMHAQLIYYVYLLNTEIQDAHVSGIFEQTIFIKTLNQDHPKTYEMLEEEYFKLKGAFEDDLDILGKLDTNYQEATYIKGLKVKKDGTLSATAPSYKQETLNKAMQHIESLILEAIDDIFSLDFKINPIKDQSKYLSCKYCKFSDICFKKPHHARKLDLSESLFDYVRREDDER